MEKNTNGALDTFDLAILRILQKDNAVPHRVIGEEVNLSAPSVQRRIRRLEKSGVIAANVSILDPAKVDLSLTIIVEVELVSETAEGIDSIKKLFAGTPQVQQCYYVTGEVDFMLVMVVRNMTEYEELTRSLFFENEIVRKFRTFVSMDRVKTRLELQL